MVLIFAQCILLRKQRAQTSSAGLIAAAAQLGRPLAWTSCAEFQMVVLGRGRELSYFLVCSLPQSSGNAAPNAHHSLGNSSRVARGNKLVRFRRRRRRERESTQMDTRVGAGPLAQQRSLFCHCCRWAKQAELENNLATGQSQGAQTRMAAIKQMAHQFDPTIPNVSLMDRELSFHLGPRGQMSCWRICGHTVEAGAPQVSTPARQCLAAFRWPFWASARQRERGKPQPLSRGRGSAAAIPSSQPNRISQDSPLPVCESRKRVPNRAPVCI